jgi:predicted small secreted protein
MSHLRRQGAPPIFAATMIAALLSSCSTTKGALKDPPCGGKAPTFRTVARADKLPLPRVETDGSPVFVKAYRVDSFMNVNLSTGFIYAGSGDVAPDVLARGNVNEPTITINAAYGKWYPIELTAGAWWLMESQTNGFQLAWCNPGAVKDLPDLAAP